MTSYQKEVDKLYDFVAEVGKNQFAIWTALAIALVKKGVLTEQEIVDMMPRAIAAVDQQYAAELDRQIKEADDELPGFAEYVKKVMEDDV